MIAYIFDLELKHYLDMLGWKELTSNVKSDNLVFIYLVQDKDVFIDIEDYKYKLSKRITM